MDLTPPAPALTAAPLAAAPPGPRMETVTLSANGAATSLPEVDAAALVSAGLATAPVPALQAIVLLSDIGAHKRGAVLNVPATLATSLGDKARAATAAEQEIGGPNLKTVTTI